MVNYSTHYFSSAFLFDCLSLRFSGEWFLNRFTHHVSKSRVNGQNTKVTCQKSQRPKSMVNGQNMKFNAYSQMVNDCLSSESQLVYLYHTLSTLLTIENLY